MQASVTHLRDPNGCMMGRLQDWPLQEVMNWLHKERRTAMLRVGLGLDAAILFFEDGHLYRAEWREQQGKQVLLGLLGVVSGHFVIMQRPMPGLQPNIREPTSELLLQYALIRERRFPTSRSA